MSDKSNFYPLGHSLSEAERLDEQAKLLEEQSLGVLIRKASDCLEIGCGVGSHLTAIAKANPNVRYTGIDCGVEALAEAKRKAEALSLSATFFHADAHELPFATGSFDLVFAKLVLWSVGPRWEQVIAEAHRVLKLGGMLYLFEPDDRFLVFSPSRPSFEAVIKRWQDLRIASGLDPFIGSKLHGALVRSGLLDVQAYPFNKVSSGDQIENYRAHLGNLIGIFMGNGAAALNFNGEAEPWKSASRTLDSISAEDYLVETHFVAIARKASAS